MLTSIQIEKFASAKDANKKAVENFLITLNGSTMQDALANLDSDAKSYKWKAPTKNAIRKGILAHFKK